MSTWQEMLQLEPPVEGNSDDYATANIETQRVCESVAQVAAEFSRLKGTGSIEEMQGQAGDQLRVLVDAVDGSLNDLPRLLTDVHEVFRSHTVELERLEAAASSALARAQTSWAAKSQAKAQQDSAEMYLSGIKSSITMIHWNPSDDPAMDQPALDSLYAQEQAQYATINMHGSEIALADADLALVRADHAVIVEEELVLRQTTVNNLHGIDLGDLDDPGRAMAILGAIGGAAWDLGAFVYGIGESFVKAGLAVLSGDIMDALWHLSDALGDVLTVLAVIALVVAVIATGGGALVFVALALGAAKLAIDASLALTKHPHPETGEEMSWKSVAVDAVILGLSFATMGASNHLNGTARPFGSILTNWNQGVRFGAAGSSTFTGVIGTTFKAGITSPNTAALGELVDGGLRVAPFSEGVVAAGGIAADFVIGGSPVGDGAGFDGGIVNGVADAISSDSLSMTTNPDAWDDALSEMLSVPAPPVIDNIHAMNAQVWDWPADFLTMDPAMPSFELVEVGE